MLVLVARLSWWEMIVVVVMTEGSLMHGAIARTPKDNAIAMLSTPDSSIAILLRLPALTLFIPILGIAGLVPKHIATEPPPNHDAHGIRHSSHQPIWTPPKRHTTFDTVHH